VSRYDSFVGEKEVFPVLIETVELAVGPRRSLDC
jgi:hypothetical protein